MLRPLPLVALGAVFTGVVGAQIDNRETTRPAPPRSAQPEATDRPPLTVAEAVALARSAVETLAENPGEAAAAQAEVDLDRAFAVVKTQAPDHPWLPYIAAGVYRAAGQDFDAVTELERFIATREGKNEWMAHRLLGDLVIEGDFPRLARSHFQNAARLKENEPSVLFGLSRCAAAIGDYDEALDFAQQAVAADGRSSVRLLNHLARVARIKQEWSTATTAVLDALEVTRRRAENNPGAFAPLTELEAQYQIVIDVESARVQELRDPNELTRAYLELVQHTRERGDAVTRITRHDVVRVLEQAIERLGEDTPIALLEESLTALTKADRTDDAADVCRRILARDPENALATRWIEAHKTPAADPAAPTPDAE